MAMFAGFVAIADDETVTSMGFAEVLYDADIVTSDPLPDVPVVGSTDPPWRVGRAVTTADADSIKSQRLAILREKARRATAQAAAIVSYLTDNAEPIVGGVHGTLT